MKKQDVIDVIRTFYPTLATVIVLPMAMLSGHPWIGIVIFIIILYLRKTWWTCIFGLLNGAALWSGIIGCSIPYVLMVCKLLGK
jgi:hypothetical protein